MKLLEQIQLLDFPAPLPETLLVVEQRFDAPQVPDVDAAARQALEASGMLAQMQPGQTVAVGAGSRGIANLPAIVRAVVARLKEAGLKPYVVPAMGSHGGATADGQKTMLAELGVTEANVGTEIRSTMEVKQIGQIPDGPALYQGVDSMAADHAILVSRIKPHTDFRSHLESGPSKMCVIGWGKQHGAALMHSGGARTSRSIWHRRHASMRPTPIFVVQSARLRMPTTARQRFMVCSLQRLAWSGKLRFWSALKLLMASLPFPEIDILVVQQLGKNISGTGMDTNIISRLMIPRQPEAFGKIDVAVIAVMDLTEETHGNVAGLGLANITTARVAQKIDRVATYTNCITSGIFGMFRVSLPITMPDDMRALHVAVRGCATGFEEPRMVFMRDTLTVDKLWVSPNLRQAVEDHPRLTIVDEVPLAFGKQGNMRSPWALSEVALPQAAAAVPV